MPGEKILARKVFAQAHVAKVLGVIFFDEGAHFVAEGLLFRGEFEVHMLKLRFPSAKARNSPSSFYRVGPFG